jgi:hypothetical protein
VSGTDAGSKHESNVLPDFDKIHHSSQPARRTAMTTRSRVLRAAASLILVPMGTQAAPLAAPAVYQHAAQSAGRAHTAFAIGQDALKTASASTPAESAAAQFVATWAAPANVAILGNAAQKNQAASPVQLWAVKAANPIAFPV